MAEGVDAGHQVRGVEGHVDALERDGGDAAFEDGAAGFVGRGEVGGDDGGELSGERGGRESEGLECVEDVCEESDAAEL